MTLARLPSRSGTMTDTMVAPQLHSSTVFPCELLSVYRCTSRPSAVWPQTFDSIFNVLFSRVTARGELKKTYIRFDQNDIGEGCSGPLNDRLGNVLSRKSKRYKLRAQSVNPQKYRSSKTKHVNDLVTLLFTSMLEIPFKNR